jgi:DNA-binding CsgD family transcriptional regulator
VTITDDYLPEWEKRTWLDLVADIAPEGASAPSHSAAARVVTDPDTIKQIRLHDDDVKVEARLRRKGWVNGEEAGEAVMVPLSRIRTYLAQFDVLDIGATTHPRRPILLDALSFEIVNGSAYACVCMDWRGLGDMITSRYRLTAGPNSGQTFGSVIGRAAARSGTDGVNERRRLARKLLDDEYGSSPVQETATGAQVALQLMALAIVEHFTSGAVGCAPPVRLWLVLCDGEILASSPVPEKERPHSGVLADKIDGELSNDAFGASHPQYQKARQWQIHYDEEFDNDNDDEKGKKPPPGVVTPRSPEILRGNFGEPADVLGIRLADDDLWPSELLSLKEEYGRRFDWPELLEHLVGMRTKLSLTEREAKFLFLLEQGYSQVEIARLTGWSEATVSRKLQRAVERILLVRKKFWET